MRDAQRIVDCNIVPGKPHLRYVQTIGSVRMWLCKGMGFGAYGSTPKFSYANWANRRDMKLARAAS